MESNYIEFIITALVLAYMPGPDVLYVATQSIINGVRAGIYSAIGFALGIIIHTSIVATGLALIIKNNQWLFNTIKIFGVCYLLYLGVKSVTNAIDTRKKKKNEELEIEIAENKVEKLKLRNAIGRTLLMSISNPKLLIFFLSLFPQFIVGETNTLLQIAILGSTMSVLSLFAFISIALILSRFKKYISVINSGSQTAAIIMLTLYIAIAVMLIIS